MRRVFSALLLTLLLGPAAALADVEASLAHPTRWYEAPPIGVFCLPRVRIPPVNPAPGALGAPLFVSPTYTLI